MYAEQTLEGMPSLLTEAVAGKVACRRRGKGAQSCFVILQPFHALPHPEHRFLSHILCFLFVINEDSGSAHGCTP